MRLPAVSGALSILAVSECLPTSEADSSEQREKNLGPMIEVSLEAAPWRSLVRRYSCAVASSGARSAPGRRPKPL